MRARGTFKLLPIARGPAETELPGVGHAVDLRRLKAADQRTLAEDASELSRVAGAFGQNEFEAVTLDRRRDQHRHLEMAAGPLEQDVIALARPDHEDLHTHQAGARAVEIHVALHARALRRLLFPPQPPH